ncbi:MAG: hypothetical protein GX652_10665 [Burkholderiaceae bacterium]|nr:hypothetical protein [Burkholderiaceae bacterium]
MSYWLDERVASLVDARGRRLDAATRNWQEAPQVKPEPPPGARRLEAPEAVAWLQEHSGHPIRVPVGVIGPRDATSAQMAVAQRVGAGLAQMGLAVVCGGRQGIMEAVAQGASGHDGIVIGLLPEPSPEAANPFLTHVIATGLGEARNALIARSAFCLVAIGDSYGTLSEVALGLQFGKRVFGLAGAARVHGVEHRSDAEAALLSVANHILAN